jgi:hypothetical protein
VLLQDLKIVINSGIQKLNVVGDSKNVTRHMVLNTTLIDSILDLVASKARIQKKNHELISSMF